MRNLPTILKEQQYLKKRILVIENDSELRRVLSMIFDHEGYEYYMLAETFDILQLTRQYQPDLILLDFALPLVNGGELCLQLKGEMDTNSIPVLIYSAAPRTFFSIRNYGNDFFLAKPFNLDDLVSTIRELIARKEFAERN